ncbi:MAG: hypothetical protein SFU57_02230 [Gemmatimonadales bacterium]|nr:hypothetical protein [Gemmatimonadales bacterium]
MVAIVGVVALAACAGETSPTGDSPFAPTPSLAVGDATDATPEFGKIKVCKSAGSNVSGTFTVSRVPIGAANVGTVLANPTIDPGNCIVVAEDNSGANEGSTVTITETSSGLVSIAGQRIDADLQGGPDIISASPFTNGDNRPLNIFHGFTITFENFVEPPPPPPPPVGGQGCSPGYWKNHNFPAGFSKGQLFNSDIPGNDFENAFPGKSFQEVLSGRGGGLTALGRHTVSAYFNAVALGSDYELTPAEVVAKFNAAFPGGDYGALSNEFAALEDVDGRICPNPTGR